MAEERGGRVPREVGLVAAAIKRDFGGLISVDDMPSKDPYQREQKLLSRGLAALIARQLTGCDNETAAGFVVDGFDDYGIDAVAILEGAPRLWLIQSKWSDQGRASLKMNDALQMVNGFKRIDQRQYDRLNERYTSLADQINRVLDHPDAHITLLAAVMGQGQLSSSVIECFEDAKKEFNSFSPDRPIDYGVRGALDAKTAILEGLDVRIDLSVPVTNWFRQTAPYDAFQGSVSVGEVASWYEKHRDRLFDRNIRQSLGLTPANSAISATLKEHPELFWYFNNGITVTCDKADPHPFSISDPNGPITLDLTNVSVVNGAQTVTTISAVFEQHPDLVAGAQVSVKVIATRNSPDGFGEQITKAANTQNRVEPQDFAALDPMQASIRSEFQVKLEKTYVYRRGETPPAPDAGCTMEEAGLALVCAHNDARLAVRVKARIDALWEKEGQGVYTRIFRRAPDSAQIWRSVRLLRDVREALDREEKERRNRAAAVAEHGDLLLAHIVFQRVGLDHLDDTTEEWDSFRASVPGLVTDVLDRLISYVDIEFGSNSFIRSTFLNEDRCRLLVRRILTDLEEGAPPPQVPDDYRREENSKPRRPNTVAVLVDADRVPEGAELRFVGAGAGEEEALAEWLAADARRTQATWTGQRGKALLWAADNRRYSPTGLVQHMWRLAEWNAAPVAVQGTKRWEVPGQGTLVELAEEVLRERDLHEL
ncbi:AIPR family protein [Actinomadura bangladeshensis]|uniref:AIPR family protein n=1 Tax=Actinomadura bangladeshensis TaxID=453573 RepID=A0A6L9QPB5_9ACTN|nr:AIPR family protein [Actinomadura bangladeshensis]NEA27335.1 AIPR family protein [Actinomadura bangladeshensis]